MTARHDKAIEGRGRAESIARQFHETYERLAPTFGYSTRDRSRVPWPDVPEDNRRLMVAVVEEVVIPALASGGRTEAAAIDQAIAWMRARGWVHGRVLADAVEELRAKITEAEAWLANETSRRVAAEAENVRLARQVADLEGLLSRLRQWDHLEGAHDGPYWKTEIDTALAAARSRDPQAQPSADREEPQT